MYKLVLTVMSSSEPVLGKVLTAFARAPSVSFSASLLDEEPQPQLQKILSSE